MTKPYSYDPFNAFEALSEAQKLAFSPIAFQAVSTLLDLNILLTLQNAGKAGMTIDNITKQVNVTEYGTTVLLDMGLSVGVVYRKDDKYILGKMGEMLLDDGMTHVNWKFTQDVCYDAMRYLRDSIEQEKPEGLKTFGDWPTIYPGLSKLPEPAKTSWHEFDHFYSDIAFESALPIVFKQTPSLIFDLGGNTGKWAISCAKYNDKVQVKILDLPEQLAIAEENCRSENVQQRVSGYPINLLKTETPLPEGADVYWMSQFLDCFSEAEIIMILTRIRNSMKPGAKIYILELFWDNQKFDAAKYSINATSLYFTCLANGNSRFYELNVFKRLIHESSLQIDELIEDFGIGHTLITCSPAT